MSAPPSSDATSGTPPSLLASRVAAAIGVIVAVVLVVLAFTVNGWLGLGVAFVSPVVPMLFVLGAEAARR